MSIIVKGIELPEKVQVLELHPDGKVFTRKGYLVGEAVELPDRHGRLVDADKCEGYFWEHLDDNGMAGAMNAINEMPTIVEAEGEE